MKKYLILATAIVLSVNPVVLPLAQAQNSSVEEAQAAMYLQSVDVMAAKLLLQIEKMQINKIIKNEGDDKAFAISSFRIVNTDSYAPMSFFLGSLSLVIAESAKSTIPDPSLSITGVGPAVARDIDGPISAQHLNGAASISMSGGFLFLDHLFRPRNPVEANLKNLGLGDDSMRAVVYSVDTIAEVLSLTPSQKQRLLDSTVDAIFTSLSRLTPGQPTVVDVGQLAIKMQLIDAPTRVAFESLREIQDSRVSDDEMRVKMGSYSKGGVVYRLEMLKVLEQETTALIQSDSSVGDILNPQLARTRMAIAYLENLLL